MDADLVPFPDDTTLLVAIKQRDDARHIEGCRHRMSCEQFQDARHADAIAILSPRQTTDRFAAVAQLVRLVIGIEGKREGAARATLPALRTKAAAGADLVDETAPMGLRPLPGLELCQVVHEGLPACSFQLASRQRVGSSRYMASSARDGAWACSAQR